LRSTMNAVDAQVQGQITVLRALAAMSALDNDDLAAFEREAGRVLRSHPEWLNIVLAQTDGRQLVNTAAPVAVAAKRPLFDTAVAQRVTSTRQPAVGSMLTAPLLKQRGVNVAVPVMRGDEVRYVLLAFMKPDLFVTPIERQRIGAGWVSGLVDAEGAFIARVPPAPAERAGKPFLDAVRRAPEGWYRGLTTEGFDSYTAHVTSAFTNWSIGLGIPADEVLADARRTAWVMGAGIAASLAIAAFLALWLGRRVADPVARLATAAPSIATGTPTDLRGLDRVREVRTVAVALNEAADAVRERQNLLEREKQALQEADRAKDEFIAMMSHELRNPIAALSSASRLLEMVEADSDAARHARDVISRQTKHTARLIEDLLDTSRVVMGKAYLQPEVFDLAEAASSLVATWRSAGRLGGHHVTLTAASAWIRADRARVEQILSNLLDNALKFSPEGSACGVSVAAEGSHAVLRVADEGPGLSSEMMTRVFDLFVQGGQGLARKSGGMGIGLALVKRLAELQGGTVSVASEGEGRGAVFTVRFPSVSPPPARPALSIITTPVALRRILLIDDNDDMRRTLATCLTIQGHHVSEAGDGLAALDIAAEIDPEVIIVDIGLPGIDGYEVARRLRANPATRDVRLVALTGYGQQEDKQKALKAGFDEHLTKPVDTALLEQLIAGSSPPRHSMKSV
jgi:signal transduction histidine kinase/ActR/RegA family two-component response regulator